MQKQRIEQNSVRCFIVSCYFVKTSVLMSTSVECMIDSKPKSLICFYFMMYILSQFQEIARLLFNLNLPKQHFCGLFQFASLLGIIVGTVFIVNSLYGVYKE